MSSFFVKEMLIQCFHALPDRDGTFRIADVKDGKYNLLVRLVGYDLYNRPGIVLVRFRKR